MNTRLIRVGVAVLVAVAASAAVVGWSAAHASLRKGVTAAPGAPECYSNSNAQGVYGQVCEVEFVDGTKCVLWAIVGRSSEAMSCKIAMVSPTEELPMPPRHIHVSPA